MNISLFSSDTRCSNTNSGRIRKLESISSFKMSIAVLFFLRIKWAKYVTHNAIKGKVKSSSAPCKCIILNVIPTTKRAIKKDASLNKRVLMNVPLRSIIIIPTFSATVTKRSAYIVSAAFTDVSHPMRPKSNSTAIGETEKFIHAL